MSPYEERLGRDLTHIRQRVKEVGVAVQSALDAATRALMTADREGAADTILGDLAVNRMTREIDRLCHAFVARHLPSAGNLRFVSSVLRMNIALERIGDYAETIARTAVQLSGMAPEAVVRDMEMMADQSHRLLREAMKAFNDLNADRARATMGMAGQFATTFDKVFSDLIREGETGSRPINDLFLMLASFNRLERVIHQAKNICEETLFAVTGETKPPKKLDVLFVDETGADLAAMAQGHATKAYPNAATYSHASVTPGEVNPGLAAFGEAHGIELEDVEIQQLSSHLSEVNDFDLIVFLEGGAFTHLKQIPFHTVVLDWKIDRGDGSEQALGTAYKEIVHELRELMDRLVGEDAG